VVLASGGLDSTTLLFLYLKENFRALPLIVDYGQVAFSRELATLSKICSSLGIRGPYQLEVPKVGLICENQLTSMQSKTPMFPHRNLLLLTLAAIFSEANNCQAIAFGVVADSLVAFPDCSSGFVHSTRIALSQSIGKEFTISTPFLNSTKSEVIRDGLSLSVPYEYTYSCYSGNVRHCGKCLGCKNRKRAFKLAHIADPTRYQKVN
jgi:7-cyano-7-deazaguanine synthase